MHINSGSEVKFNHSDEVGAWLKMTDQGDSIMAISSYAGANSGRNSKKKDAASFDPAASAALPPLAALSRLAAPSMAPLQGSTLTPFVGAEP